MSKSGPQWITDAIYESIDRDEEHQKLVEDCVKEFFIAKEVKAIQAHIPHIRWIRSLDGAKIATLPSAELQRKLLGFGVLMSDRRRLAKTGNAKSTLPDKSNDANNDTKITVPGVPKPDGAPVKEKDIDLEYNSKNFKAAQDYFCFGNDHPSASDYTPSSPEYDMLRGEFVRRVGAYGLKGDAEDAVAQAGGASSRARQRPGDGPEGWYKYMMTLRISNDKNSSDGSTGSVQELYKENSLQDQRASLDTVYMVASPHNYHDVVKQYTDYGFLFEIQLLDELSEIVKRNWASVQSLESAEKQHIDDKWLDRLEVHMSGSPYTWPHSMAKQNQKVNDEMDGQGQYESTEGRFEWDHPSLKNAERDRYANEVDAWFMTVAGPLIADGGNVGSEWYKDGKTCRHEHLMRGGSVLQRIYRVGRGPLSRSKLLQDYLLRLSSVNELALRYLEQFRHKMLGSLQNAKMSDDPNIISKKGPVLSDGSQFARINEGSVEGMKYRLKMARQLKNGIDALKCPAGKTPMYYSMSLDSNGNAVLKDYIQNPYISVGGQTIVNPRVNHVECGDLVPESAIPDTAIAPAVAPAIAPAVAAKR